MRDDYEYGTSCKSGVAIALGYDDLAAGKQWTPGKVITHRTGNHVVACNLSNNSHDCLVHLLLRERKWPSGSMTKREGAGQPSRS